MFDLDRTEECDALRDHRVGKDPIITHSGRHVEARGEDYQYGRFGSDCALSDEEHAQDGEGNYREVKRDCGVC